MRSAGIKHPGAGSVIRAWHVYGGLKWAGGRVRSFKGPAGWVEAWVGCASVGGGVGALYGGSVASDYYFWTFILPCGDGNLVLFLYLYVGEGKKGKTRICLEWSHKKINILRAMREREREETRRSSNATLRWSGDKYQLEFYWFLCTSWCEWLQCCC